jgi:hypothetical protein
MDTAQETHNTCTATVYAAYTACNTAADDITDNNVARNLAYDACCIDLQQATATCDAAYQDDTHDCRGGPDCPASCYSDYTTATGACPQCFQGVLRNCQEACDTTMHDCTFGCASTALACLAPCSTAYTQCKSACQGPYSACMAECPTGDSSGFECRSACHGALMTCEHECDITAAACTAPCNAAQERFTTTCETTQGTCYEDCAAISRQSAWDAQKSTAEAFRTRMRCEAQCCGTTYSQCTAECDGARQVAMVACNDPDPTRDPALYPHCIAAAANAAELCAARCWIPVVRAQQVYNPDVFECIIPCHEALLAARLACVDNPDPACTCPATAAAMLCKTACCMDKEPPFPHNDYMPCAQPCWHTYWLSGGDESPDAPTLHTALQTCLSACPPAAYGHCSICTTLLPAPAYLATPYDSLNFTGTYRHLYNDAG